MDQLIEKYRKKLVATPLEFVRSSHDKIAWKSRLIGIKGARGIGKTTMLLQHIKAFMPDVDSTLYVTLDDIWFSDNKLVDLADRFVKYGGRSLFLDEVHKYPNWSQEVKNIYDDYPELHIVFTGSSLLEILNARADLSRRAITYEMQGLSFREYLNLVHGTNFRIYSLEEILHSHEGVSREVLREVKPLPLFDMYLQKGYYPFVVEEPDLYHERLAEVVNMIIEVELPLLRNVAIHYTKKLKQLLLAVAESAPFIPNVSHLAERTSINRNTLVTYLHYLSESGLTYPLHRKASGITRMQKPEKLYLENSNLAYAILGPEPNKGGMRETFFANQISHVHKCTYPPKGDFLVDSHWLFEIGGRNKSTKQISEWQEGDYFVARDGIEYGYSNHIPLWQFGFLY